MLKALPIIPSQFFPYYSYHISSPIIPLLFLVILW